MNQPDLLEKHLPRAQWSNRYSRTTARIVDFYFYRHKVNGKTIPLLETVTSHEARHVLPLKKSCPRWCPCSFFFRVFFIISVVAVTPQFAGVLRCHRNALVESNATCYPSPRLRRCYNQIACRGSFGSLLLGNGLGIVHFGQRTTIKVIIAITRTSTRVFSDKMTRWDVSVCVYFVRYGHPRQAVCGHVRTKPKVRVIEHNALVLYIYELLRCSNGFASSAAKRTWLATKVGSVRGVSLPSVKGIFQCLSACGFFCFNLLAVVSSCFRTPR